MDVAVLHPHDCLQNKPYHTPPTMKPPKPRSSRNRHKRNNNNITGTAVTSTDTKTLVNNNNKNLLIGQVKILKRGEQLPQTTPFPPQLPKKKLFGDQLTKTISFPPQKEKKLFPRSGKVTKTTPVPRSEKKMLPLPEKEIKVLPLPVKEKKVSPLPEKVAGHLYAGASTVSPPASSVPLPIFITKKIALVSDATNDLRRMLRLDFP